MSRKTARNADRVPDLGHIARQRNDRARRWNLAMRIWQAELEKNKLARMPFTNRKTHRAFMAGK